MTAKKPGGTEDTPIPGEAGIGRTYRGASKETPSAALDAKILAEARHAVSTSKARTAFGARWRYPLSTAAVVVLSLGVVLLLSQQGVLDHESLLTPPSGTIPAPEVARDTTETPATPAAKAPASPERKVLAKTESAKPEPAPPVAADSAPAAMADHMHARQSGPEVQTLTGASIATGRIAEERAASPMHEIERAREDTAMNNGTTGVQADVISVQASGEPGAYQFTVGIRSPDTGCGQYADWWEVLNEKGELLYRRVLLHSHVSEQPFLRSGGPVPIQPDTVVWVRAHMNSAGYGGVAYKGSVKSGFIRATLDRGFAADLATRPPLPDGCGF